MISSSRVAATPRQLGSSALRKAKSVSTAKVLRERIKRNDDERLPRVLDCRKWKLRRPETTTGPRKKHTRAGGNEPGTTRGRATAGPQQLRRGPAAPAAICPHLDSRSKTDLETQRTGKKLSEHAPTQRKARAREEPSPGPPASKDGRATTGPPAPRRDPGVPAVQLRPRGLDLESAQV